LALSHVDKVDQLHVGPVGEQGVGGIGKNQVDQDKGTDDKGHRHAEEDGHHRERLVPFLFAVFAVFAVVGALAGPAGVGGAHGGAGLVVVDDLVDGPGRCVGSHILILKFDGRVVLELGNG